MKGIVAEVLHLPQVWGLPSVDTGELVLYPHEDPPLIEVTPDVAALWHGVQVRWRMLHFEEPSDVFVRLRAAFACISHFFESCEHQGMGRPDKCRMIQALSMHGAVWVSGCQPAAS